MRLWLDALSHVPVKPVKSILSPVITFCAAWQEVPALVFVLEVQLELTLL